MSTPKIDLIRDPDGTPRPDLDYRDVPARVMAEYLGISVKVLWSRTLQGFYGHGVVRCGRQNLYRPRIIVGERL